MDRKSDDAQVSFQTSSRESPRNRPTSPNSSGRNTPPPDCAICLEKCRNKCFTDSCLHQFCFNCLLTWSKIKAECPLCKQPFKVIIHNVRANDQYEEYKIDTSPINGINGFIENIMNNYDPPPRYRYRTTLTLQRQQGIEIQRLLMLDNPINLHQIQPTPPRIYPRLSRQNIYRRNMWAAPLPDVTGRYRECSPEFYRNNPAQIHRLAAWLRRELPYITPDTEIILPRIMDHLLSHPIISPAFMHLLTPHLQGYTEHFLHEFYSFASSPYDMIGYDRSVQHHPFSQRTLINNTVNEISSDSSDSSDSDIEFVFSAPGPSHSFPAPMVNLSEPSTSSDTGLGSLSNPVIPIETIMQSDNEDSDDEVVMVRYIKLPQDQPEVVDLAASDSDSMIIEENRVPSPIEVLDEQSNSPQSSVEYMPNNDMPSTSGVVKVSLKRKRTHDTRSIVTDSDNDSDSDVRRVRKSKKNKRSKKHRRSFCDISSTECTDRDTDCSDGHSNQPSYNGPSTSSQNSSLTTQESRAWNLASKIRRYCNKFMESSAERQRKYEISNNTIDSDVMSDSNEETESSHTSRKMKGLSYKKHNSTSRQ